MQSHLIAELSQLEADARSLAERFARVRRQLPNGEFLWRMADDGVTYCYQAAGNACGVRNNMQRKLHEDFSDDVADFFDHLS